MPDQGSRIDESQVDAMLEQLAESERDWTHSAGASKTPSYFKWQEANSHLDPEDRNWLYFWNVLDDRGRIIWLAVSAIGTLIAAGLLSLVNR